MIALADEGLVGEVEDFMVDPAFQGRGVGAALMGALLSECRARGLHRIGLDADPNAEAIYRKLGFLTVGWSPSRSIPGRALPRMVRAI
jgi:GNAT superfamily N-acetyltransferase